MNKTVSVIVAIYNVEEYIANCIESIQKQTYENLEIFLVDDGSTDQSGKICDQYAENDSRIRVIHKENGGQATARNMALDICTGDYVLFVDGDDYIVETMVESLLKGLLEYDVDYSQCGWIYNYGKLKKKRIDFEETTLISGIENIITEDLVNHRGGGVVTCKLFKREIFDDIRFPKFRAGEDSYCIVDIFAKCSATVYINEALYIVNIREGSTEHKKFTKAKLASIDIAKHWQEMIRERVPKLYPLVYFKYADALKRVMARIVSDFAYKEFKELYKELREEFVEEVARLESDPELNKNNKQYKELKWIYDHPKRFICSERINGVKRKIRTFVKNILAK